MLTGPPPKFHGTRDILPIYGCSTKSGESIRAARTGQEGRIPGPLPESGVRSPPGSLGRSPSFGTVTALRVFRCEVTSTVTPEQPDTVRGDARRALLPLHAAGSSSSPSVRRGFTSGSAIAAVNDLLAYVVGDCGGRGVFEGKGRRQ
jgi:hypothetical protein